MRFEVACLILLAFATTNLAAADGVSLSLFDGQTLADWTLENGAEADIVDGQLRLKSGNGWLRSNSQYRDFKLHVEWKALQADQYDAGIYIRTANTGAPFPKPSYQVNLLDGAEGNIGTLPGAKSTGFIKRGDWNAFDLVVEGEQVSLEINGRSAYSVGGLKRAQGYIGFQIEVPKGGQFLIRKVQLTEIGHRALFDGKSLAGWDGADAPAETCWAVSEGHLVCDGKKGPWLRSTEQFGDFNFRFDYWLSDGGNSGIYVRVPKDGNHHRDKDSLPPAGFEVQVLDDAAPQYAKLKDYQYSASVYDIAGAMPRVSLPAGQWNSMEINCVGQHITTIHNGRIVVNIDSATAPLLALRETSGYLGLQNHSSVVKFRNVRIGEPLDYPIESASAK